MIELAAAMRQKDAPRYLYDITTVFVWLEVELAWSIITASLPFFRAALKPMTEIPAETFANDVSKSDDNLHVMNEDASILFGSYAMTKFSTAGSYIGSPVVELMKIQQDPRCWRADQAESSGFVEPNTSARRRSTVEVEHGAIRKHIAWEIRYESI